VREKENERERGRRSRKAEQVRKKECNEEKGIAKEEVRWKWNKRERERERENVNFYFFRLYFKSPVHTNVPHTPQCSYIQDVTKILIVPTL
jgi:hypothetical protein